VALSGDGGDELMRGYGRYDRAVQPWEKMRRIPLKVRQAIGKLLLNVPAATWDSSFAWLNPLFSQVAPNDPFGEKIYKIGDAFNQPDFLSFYKYKISQYKNPEQVVVHSKESLSILDVARSNTFFQDNDIAMLFVDAMMYLPDDILVKVDRAAMGVSLETRIPLLDHRVVEFVWRLPNRFRWQPGCNKWALRQVLYRYVPQAILDRPKQGFGVPVTDWLKGPLYDWCDNLLDAERIKTHGLFNAELVAQLWRQHQSGRYNRDGTLWAVLMAGAMHRTGCRDFTY
ncbi:MAG: asparagine synthetase B, partial [Candidatus Electrothrix sp. AR5]|nr:asparagine synthetase B [Candidatus Electrothrix sp. AR5]